MFVIGTPYIKGAGYLLNNKDDASTRIEADMRTCTHCQAAINMQLWQKKGAWCNGCASPICLPCGKIMLTNGCEPFNKKFDKFLEMQHFLQRVAGGEPVPQQLIITGK